MAIVSSVAPSPLAPNAFTDVPPHTASARVPQTEYRTHKRMIVNAVFISDLLTTCLGRSLCPGLLRRVVVSKTEECNGEQNDCSYASELIHDFLSSSSAQCDLNNAGLRATF